MIARINLLLGIVALAVVTLYLVGRFLVVAPIAAVAPQWTTAVTSAYILISLALSVLFISKVVRRLESMSQAARQLEPGISGVTGQFLMALAHACIAVWIYRLTAGLLAWNLLLWTIAIFMYMIGVASALVDMRDRATRAR